VRKGVRAALILSIATVAALGAIVLLFAPQCISFFSKDPEVIEAGSRCIRCMCPFYFALCIHQVFSGALRASGRSSIPMITSIISFVVVRQIFLALALKLTHDISIVAYGYSFTWCLAAALTGCYYAFSRWLTKEERGAASVS
jgi:Na+-driven multidrug efflux pump